MDSRQSFELSGKSDQEILQILIKWLGSDFISEIERKVLPYGRVVWTADREVLCNAVNALGDEFIREGLNEKQEPNSYGLHVEDLMEAIDFV